MTADRIATTPMRASLWGAAQLGVDVALLLEDLGLPAALQFDPAAVTGASVEQALWLECEKRCARPDLALATAAALPFGAFEVLDYVSLNQPNLGAGIDAMVRYFDMVYAGFSMVFKREGERATLSRPPPGPGLQALGRFSSEYTFAIILARFRLAAGVEWDPLIARFTHPEPDYRESYERLFRCPLEFNAEADELMIEASTLAIPLLLGDPALGRILEQHAQHLLRALPERGRVSRQVRELLKRDLKSSESPAVDAVARELGMSARTLSRRLEDEGTSYRALFDDMRQALACSYLEQARLGVAEVAYLLDFADARAFNRAFKRWTKQTPTQWREARSELKRGG